MFSQLCPICELHVEKLEHLFVKCEVTFRTWDIDVLLVLCPTYELHVEQLEHLFVRCEMAPRTLDIDVLWVLCLICELHVEQPEHLFFVCEVTTRTKNALFRWLEFGSIYESFCLINSLTYISKKKEASDAIVCTTIGYICRFWNDLCLKWGNWEDVNL
ncbi:hypothetical protein LXL04_016849 [Taraxacum kok-saghyz]